MDLRQAPGIGLVVMGGVLLFSLFLTFPSTSQGGPAVGYALFVAVCLGGGGIAAIGVGLYSLRAERTRLPAVLLSAYTAIGIVSATVRLRLFLGLSAVGFTLAAIGFVVVVIYGTYRVTDRKTNPLHSHGRT